MVDPTWVTKLMAGKEEEIKPCIRCHNACFTMAKYEGSANDQDLIDALKMARCALNPITMQTKKYKVVETNNPKKVAIIGGGVGGMEIALLLKARGHQPVIYEKSDVLGGIFIQAANFPFKENDKKLLQWYLREIKEKEIEVNFNTEIQGYYHFRC